MLARIGLQSRALMSVRARSLSSNTPGDLDVRGARDEQSYFNRKDKEAALRLLKKMEAQVVEEVELD